MKTAFHCRLTLPIHQLLALMCAVALLAASARAQDVQLKLLPSGGAAKMGGYSPQRLAISAEKPESIKKLPANLAAPLFGTLKFGAIDAPTTIAVILDEPEGRPSRLFVDSNTNGDLTDDPDTVWTSRTVKGSDGKEYHQFSGSGKVTVPLGKESASLNLPMYRFDKSDPGRVAVKGFLFYYADYAREGEVALGGKTYKALLADRKAVGDFRGKEVEGSSGVQLFIDSNKDGKLDSRSEAFDVRQPFNIDGQTYEITGLTPGGESFRIQKSEEVVAEKKGDPTAARAELLARIQKAAKISAEKKAVSLLAVDKPATAFKAKTTEGVAIDFPASFKGKIVLLDFWAIWCGPCIGELPNLTAAYQKFHKQGFEILGISLDRAGDEKKLADFTKAKKMPWPQVFDGKYWQAEVAQTYGVRSIPTAYLVDGDTGMVIANSGLRGAQLEKTIEAALAKKSGK